MNARSLILSFLILASGCSGSDLTYDKAAVHGTVTVNGEPLSSGEIRFIPLVDTVSKLTVADIVDGNYEFDVENGPGVGEHRVEIISIRKTGEKVQIPDEPEGTMREVTEQVLPAIYNTSSRLTLEVKEGENEGNFDLKMKE